jgi:hypothetical protein
MASASAAARALDDGEREEDKVEGQRQPHPLQRRPRPQLGLERGGR